MSGLLQNSESHLEKARQYLKKQRRDRHTYQNSRDHHIQCTRSEIGVTAKMQNSIAKRYYAHGMEDHGALVHIQHTPASSEAIASSINAAIQDICQNIEEEPGLSEVGSTFICTAAFRRKGKKHTTLVTANAGDSFSLLLTFDQKNRAFQEPVLLNWPHDGKDSAEADRIRKMNRHNVLAISQGRLNGILAVTRGLGNTRFVDGSRYTHWRRDGYPECVGFSHTPDFTRTGIPDNPDCKYFVLTFSDGLEYLLSALPGILDRYDGPLDQDLDLLADFLIKESCYYAESYPDDCILNIMPVHGMKDEDDIRVSFVADGHGGAQISALTAALFPAVLLLKLKNTESTHDVKSPVSKAMPAPVKPLGETTSLAVHSSSIFPSSLKINPQKLPSARLNQSQHPPNHYQRNRTTSSHDRQKSKQPFLPVLPYYSRHTSPKAPIDRQKTHSTNPGSQSHSSAFFHKSQRQKNLKHSGHSAYFPGKES